MLKKILFGCSLIAWAIGFINPGEASQWGVGLPLGAVLLFLSFIVMLLEKETALFDAEHQHTSTTMDAAQSSEKPVQETCLLNKRVAR